MGREPVKISNNISLVQITHDVLLLWEHGIRRAKKRNKKVKRKNGRPENTLLSQSSRPAGWRTNSFLQNFLRSHLYLLLNFLFLFSFFLFSKTCCGLFFFPFLFFLFFFFLKTFWCLYNFFFTRSDAWKVLRLFLILTILWMCDV